MKKIFLFFIIVIIIVNITGCEINYSINNRNTSDNQNTSAIASQGSQTSMPYAVTEPQITDKPQITPTPVPTVTSSVSSEPAPEKEDIVIVAISAGENHAAAIDNRGVLYTWGQNESGQLGDGTTADRSEPKPVPGITNAKAVACGWLNTFVLSEDGLVYSFGEHFIARDYGDNTLPVAIKELSDIIAIDTDGDSCIALKNDGTVYDWGLYSRSVSSEPEKVEELKDIVSVAAGLGYYLAVDRNGEVWTWGWSKYTDLDNSRGTGDTIGFPSKVRDIHNIKSACGKESEILGIHYDGNVTRWGNYKKEILFDSNDVVSISAVYYHILAVKKDGTVFSWGSNIHGELGNRTKEDHYEPRIIGGLSGVIAAGAGVDFSMVLKEDGTVWAWGNNEYGQLGIGTTEDQLEPQQVKFPAN